MLVVARRRGDGDVHATNLIDLVVLNLGENDLLLDTQAVVAAAVEGTGADAAEIPDARDRNAHETIEELVHAVAAGFCPVILAMSAVAASMTFLSATASPTPMLTVILRMRGTCIVFSSPSFALSSGTSFS